MQIHQGSPSRSNSLLDIEVMNNYVALLTVRRFSVSPKPHFKKAYPYQDDVLALPVTDLDEASHWYSKHFGMVEVERVADPVPGVVLERDGVRIGFAINGGDASQDGAAILVSGIHEIREEIESSGVEIGNWRQDEREGQKLQVFFVVAPDGLCYYFHEPI
jgi:catechol 2,3-dioxygenase-like lactoylglutathione lyase family enzyme